MARAQRTSRILDKAQVQLLKFRSVDPNMDFGNDRSIAALANQVEQLSAHLIDYNNSLATIDTKKLKLDDMEKTISDLVDQMMNSVSGKYGNDSREYEMAGGTRKSDRVRKISQGRAKKAAAKQLAITANN